MDDVELCLSIDLGSGGPKVALVTPTGDVLSHEVHHVTTSFSEDGGATQDAEEWWTIIAASSRRLVATLDSPSRVKAIAVTGMYACTVLVDADGLPCGPCLTWLDTRGAKFARHALGGWLQGYNPRKVLPLIRKTGGAPSTAGDDPVGHLLFLEHECPDMVSKARWYMEPIDYLTMRMTGVATATHASRLAWWLTDNRRLDDYRYDEGLLSMMGIDATKLPPLVPFGSIVGTLTSAASADLGLSSGVVVMTGIPDLHAAALGSGAIGIHDTHLALSTTSWISCPVAEKKTDIAHSIAAVPGLSNDAYVVINSQNTGAKALEWLRGVLAPAGTSLTFDEMTALAASSPPGAHGALFTPWLAGERSPVDNKKIRAGFTNLSVTTDRADLVRAVMEGVAANSAWLFGFVEKFTGQTLTPVRLVGGGAQSALWCQLYADVLDRPVEQVRDPLLAQLRGAALLAFVAVARRTGSEPVPAGTRYEPSESSEFYRARSGDLESLYRRDRRWSRARSARLR